ncbi:hypothetical protein [Bradyrhizobium elkanii]|uniref:Uncharacterized protein n=1 Tax=Bradyrhizobium elkanii TaxID=29448 RepID=A0A8I1YE91_BRAEL|nr:hypothetical protein [Bradyrhizobium elkanii]MBP1296651.1 hypothetical protein [Bradyrhizobium elkanii]
MSADAITFLISRWLAKHDLARDGVRVIIEMPDEGDAFRLSQCIKMEIKPNQGVLAPTAFGDVMNMPETMWGIGLAVTYQGGKTRRAS